MPLSAKALDEQYGPELARPPLADCGGPYLLHQALRAKGIEVSYRACRTWWAKYRVVPGQVRISSAQELEEQHGSAICATSSFACMPQSFGLRVYRRIFCEYI